MFAFDAEGAAAFNDRLAALWPQLREELQAFVMAPAEMKAVLAAAGGPTACAVPFDEWPQAWRRRYLQRKYVYRDPMVLELHRTEHPFLWADVLERRQYATRDQAIVFEAAEWGMRVGFVVPMHLTGGRVHTMTMAGASPRTDLQARAELHLISMYAHARAMRLGQNDPEEPLRLTKRERDVLQLVSTGKSDWEIGVILGISASAVHKHVENVKRRLDVGTRMQAVVAGIRSGEIAL